MYFPASREVLLLLGVRKHTISKQRETLQSRKGTQTWEICTPEIWNFKDVLDGMAHFYYNK